MNYTFCDTCRRELRYFSRSTRRCWYGKQRSSHERLTVLHNAAAGQVDGHKIRCIRVTVIPLVVVVAAAAAALITIVLIDK